MNYLGISRMNEKWTFGEFEEEDKPGFGSGVESHLRLPSKNFVEESLRFTILAAICKMNGNNRRPQFKVELQGWLVGQVIGT